MNLTNRIMIVVFLMAGLVFSSQAMAIELESDSVSKEESYWNQLRTYYDKAKETGQRAPEDVSQWVREDIEKIGDWEYKVEVISLENIEDFEEILNQLGSERWECFWIDRRESDLFLVFKRAKVSILKSFPTPKVINLIPKAE